MKYAILVTSLLVGMTAFASTCVSDISPEKPNAQETTQKPVLTVITQEFAKVANSPRFSSTPVSVVLVVPRRWESDTLEALKKRLTSPSGSHWFYHHSFIVDNEALIYLHVYGRDLIHIVDLPRIQSFDLELEDKIELGLDPHLPDRALSSRLQKFNRRLLDPIVRFPEARFEVMVGISKPDSAALARVRRRLGPEFFVENSNIHNQFILLKASGDSILSLQKIRAITHIELPHRPSSL